MTIAVRGAGGALTTLALETREAVTLTCLAVAKAFVGALSVKMCFVPLQFVGRTRQPIVWAVHFTLRRVGVVQEHLLCGIELLVGVQVAERRVRVRLGIRALPLRAVIAHVPMEAQADRGWVALTVPTAIVRTPCRHARGRESDRNH